VNAAEVVEMSGPILRRFSPPTLIKRFTATEVYEMVDPSK
jgi:hypothetical protein